jgi:hypothetical protein
VTLVVEGDPGDRFPVPTLVPSSVKVTVPDGCVEPRLEALTLADTTRELPRAGVTVAGVISTVVVTLATVKETLDEVELLKFPSPP